MAAQSPRKTVASSFGSKEKLAAQLVATMDIPEGQSKEQFQKFLQRLPNAKLLKFKRVEDAFTARFGGKREKAISAAVERRKLTGKAAEAFRAEAEHLSRARLLDLAGPATR